MDLYENVAIMSEIIVGPIAGYRNYMPPESYAELKRMLMGGQIARKERIAMQRVLIVKAWNELLHMTTAERMELRTERLFWMRQGMKLYGVAEQAVPKLRKGRPLTIHTGYGSDTLDHVELLRTILARRYPNEEIKPTFCVGCFRDLRAGKLLCARCGHWNGEVRPEPRFKYNLTGDW